MSALLEEDEYLKNQELKAIQDEQSEMEAFDKGILLLNTGAIGSSFLLLGNVFKQPIPESTSFLIGAWAAFAISSIFNVTSHLSSAKSFRLVQLDIEQRRFRNRVKPSKWWYFWKWEYSTFATIWFNRFGLISFIAGTGSLLWFGYLNIADITK